MVDFSFFGELILIDIAISAIKNVDFCACYTLKIAIHDNTQSVKANIKVMIKLV